MADSSDLPSEPIFHAAKRRKVFRRRADDEEQSHSAPVGTSHNAQTSEEKDGVEERPVFSRARVGGARKHGIAFSSSGPPRMVEDEQNTQVALVPTTQESTPANGRFVAPTGRVGPVEDKHMMAYVDSKLADLRSSSNVPSNATRLEAYQEASHDRARDSRPSHEQAAQGKLQEIDLGPYTTQRNKERTEAAQRRDVSGREPTSEPLLPPTRLGKDGKPRPRRQPPGRNTSDLARDALVDQIMRESHIPIYSRSESPPEPPGTDGENDEAFAEAFKQGFLQAIEEKNMRSKPPLPPGAVTKGGKVVEAAKGPKLGGSRSQRERMKAVEEAKGKK